MSIEDRISIEERRKYLRNMQKRYLNTDRKERGELPTRKAGVSREPPALDVLELLR